MEVIKLDITDFLTGAGQYPVLDVRSPGEYNHAHIPGAHNLPLFSDEERKIVGTAYKQQSRETAIKLGLDFFGPKMRAMVETVEALLQQYPAAGKNIGVHCWRGGMRSGAVAWLLNLYGFKVHSLTGGYKSYRHWVLEQFEKDRPFYLLGGYTGSGKTQVLKNLETHGRHIIDLEELARHKGSAFGAIGMPDQPTQEMFENLLATELHKKCTGNEPLWVEDESQRIGLVNIPINLWLHMRSRPLFFLDIPFEERLHNIYEEYGRLDREKLQLAIERIQKRLGGLETKTALQFLSEDNIPGCFRILLKYYDKWYTRGLNNRDHLEQIMHKIACTRVDVLNNTASLLQHKHPHPL